MVGQDPLRNCAHLWEGEVRAAQVQIEHRNNRRRQPTYVHVIVKIVERTVVRGLLDHTRGELDIALWRQHAVAVRWNSYCRTPSAPQHKGGQAPHAKDSETPPRTLHLHPPSYSSLFQGTLGRLVRSHNGV